MLSSPKFIKSSNVVKILMPPCQAMYPSTVGQRPRKKDLRRMGRNIRPKGCHPKKLPENQCVENLLFFWGETTEFDILISSFLDWIWKENIWVLLGGQKCGDMVHE